MNSRPRWVPNSSQRIPENECNASEPWWPMSSAKWTTELMTKRPVTTCDGRGIKQQVRYMDGQCEVARSVAPCAPTKAMAGQRCAT